MGGKGVIKGMPEISSNITMFNKIIKEIRWVKVIGVNRLKVQMENDLSFEISRKFSQKKIKDLLERQPQLFSDQIKDTEVK